MKSIRIFLPILLALFIAGKASSQLSLVVFSENGEKFTAYVNGSPVNDKPASRVETNRPGGPSFKLRILFPESSIPEISKSIFNTPGPDLYYVVKKSDKGKFILEKTTSEYVHHDDEATIAKENTAVKEETPKAEETKSEAKSSDSKGKGCSDPMEEPSFIASREMISNAPFDGPKLTQAKSMADSHCLTTDQIIDVIYLFSGESSRLNFAKYAYKHCWDPGNYDKVKDVLRSSSQTDLQHYIDSQK
jgi:hypothetical protein